MPFSNCSKIPRHLNLSTKVLNYVNLKQEDKNINNRSLTVTLQT